MALNYFYNAQIEEVPEKETLSGTHSEWIWLIILLVFLLFTHNDLNTCRHGETSTHLIFIVLALVLFTKATC